MKNRLAIYDDAVRVGVFPSRESLIKASGVYFSLARGSPYFAVLHNNTEYTLQNFDKFLTGQCGVPNGNVETATELLKRLERL